MKINLVLFAAGLVLTMATQLRPEAYPVGIGEALLVAWICLSWVDIVGRKDVRIAPDLMPFVWFFAAISAALLLSMISQMERVGDLMEFALRDLLAYFFLIVLVVTFGFLQPSRAYAWKALKLITLGLVLLNAPLLVLSKFMQHLGAVELDNGFRFFGLARNPNQLGMAMTPIPFLCWQFFREATSGFGRIGYACCFALALWIGIASVSDALVLAWIVGAGLLLLIGAVRKIAGRIHPFLIVTNVAAVCSLVVLFLAGLPSGQFVFEDIRAGDEGGVRLLVWRQALAKLFESPILGQGPGQKDLGYSYEVVIEAHNSYLDLALSTGLFGLVAALWLSAALVIRRSLVARPILWSAVMAMQCFVMFHYMFRHPVFWFYLIFMTGFAYRDYAARLQVRHVPAVAGVARQSQRA